MLKKFIFETLSKNKNLSNKQILLINHGIDILISDGRNILTVLFFSTLFRNTKSAIVYLMVLSTLRVHSGGWHASSETKCFISYQGMFVLFSQLNKLQLNRYFCLVLMIVSIVYIVRYSPVEHIYNPLLKSEKYKQLYDTQFGKVLEREKQKQE